MILWKQKEAIDYLRNNRNILGNMPTVSGETADELADLIEKQYKTIKQYKDKYNENWMYCFRKIPCL